MPFRDAHEVIGKIVLYAIQQGKFLLDLSFAEYQEFSSLFEEDIYKVLAPEHVVAVRNSFGGTAPEQVEKQIKLAEGKLAN